MTTPDLATRIPSKWRDQFRLFVETGEASEEFLDFLDANPDCQEIVEAAFAEQAKTFQAFAAQLQRLEPMPAGDAGGSRELSSAFAHTLGRAATLPQDEQDAFARDAAAAVPSSLRRNVSSIFSKFGEALRT